jgi:hypothetical protein
MANARNICASLCALCLAALIGTCIYLKKQMDYIDAQQPAYFYADTKNDPPSRIMPLEMHNKSAASSQPSPEASIPNVVYREPVAP